MLSLALIIDRIDRIDRRLKDNLKILYEDIAYRARAATQALSGSWECRAGARAVRSILLPIPGVTGQPGHHPYLERGLRTSLHYGHQSVSRRGAEHARWI
jgi:hypothetical protein